MHHLLENMLKQSDHHYDQARELYLAGKFVEGAKQIQLCRVYDDAAIVLAIVFKEELGNDS